MDDDGDSTKTKIKDNKKAATLYGITVISSLICSITTATGFIIGMQASKSVIEQSLRAIGFVMYSVVFIVCVIKFIDSYRNYIRYKRQAIIEEIHR